MRFSSLVTALVGLASTASAQYWMGNIAHQGVAPFAGSGYTVFRNVKDYGAKGDGVTDDTAAINSALTSGGRCGEGCASTTTTPAVVYFPAGTYVVSSSLQPDFFTQIIGDPTAMPTIKAGSNWVGAYIIDNDPYYTANLNWGGTNVFYRQIRNLVVDTTSVPTADGISLIHWPVGQATSLQNIVFNMPVGSNHDGLFIESGSGGFMTDLVFKGGNVGASIGNQQFTSRNLTFDNCNTAISMSWDWGWTFQGLSINNCQQGINIQSGGAGSLSVGSITVFDSSLTNVPNGAVVTDYTGGSSSPATANSVAIENVAINNVPIVVQSGSATVLAGTSGAQTIAGWGEGHQYTPNGPTLFQGSFTPNSRPASLVSGNEYYTRSKPQYETLTAADFVSVRSAGAAGNAAADDTAALQNAINEAASSGKVVYIDYGLYRVTSTITIPPNTKIVGETYPVIMASGSFFGNINSPQPVLQVGTTSGESGYVELSDFIVSGQNAVPGAILIQWNLATSGTPSGLWDVHTRIGGYTGSQLQVAQCPTNGALSTLETNCLGAYMSLHVTPSASGLYLENVWLWTADHDIDDAANTQITVFAGRGLYIESTVGTFWLYGTAVEHHTLYQYQLANTKNIYLGQAQTETPYYQPSPPAPGPWPVNTSLNDPNFSTSCSGVSGNCAMAWAFRVIDSSDVLVYGAGFYSFFNDYSTSCSTFATGESCQSRIVSLEGTISNVNIYNLNTIGSQSMIAQNGNSLASYADNENVFPSCIALFKS